MRVTALVSGVEIQHLGPSVHGLLMASCQISCFALYFWLCQPGSYSCNFITSPNHRRAQRVHRVALFLEETSKSLLGSFIRKGHCHLLSMSMAASYHENNLRKIQVRMFQTFPALQMIGGPHSPWSPVRRVLRRKA